MDSPGRHAGRQQGETMAVGTDGGKREREREGEGVGGVAVLLNFNEYQGEFLPHIFFLAPFPLFFFFFFFSWDAPIFYMALNHCHTNEL